MSRYFLVLIFALLATGCESLSSRVQERFAAAEAKTRSYEVPTADTYFAAQAALKRLDFTLTSSAQAQGRIQARSRVVPGDSLGGASQIFAEVRISGPVAGPTEVGLILYRSTEGDFRAGPDSAPLREHGLYASFFGALQAVLAEGKAKNMNK